MKEAQRKEYSTYSKESGLFVGRFLSAAPLEQLRRNASPDIGIVEGRFDRRSQKVDLETGQVIAFKPEAPSPEHSWSPDRKRWELPLPKHGNPQAAIHALEAGQDRLVRETVLSTSAALLELLKKAPCTDALMALANAHHCLATLDTQITELRKQLPQ